MTTLSTPSGIPASWISSASRIVVREACSAGFTTAVLPQASAGAIFQLAMFVGKFHGMISAQTPIGSRSV